MKEKFDDNSYNNYSILSTNLTCGSQKFKRIYRKSSPVLIQSYGNNNFVVEFKYKKKTNNNNNDEYDYIDNELKKTKINKNKAYTTYTELSNEENVYFNSQFAKPNRRYYNNYSNFDEIYQNNIYNTNNTNYIVDKSNKNENRKVYDQKKYYYQCPNYKREERDGHFYPKDKNYFYNQNLNNTNIQNYNYNSNLNAKNNNSNNNNELKYQSFSESFISKNPGQNPNRNTVSSKRKNIRRNENRNFDFNVNITSGKKERSVSKTRSQLEEYNIDKLKEIGDCYALRNKRFSNHQNGYNINNITNIKNSPNKNDMHNGIINNFINIEKKRKESKSKINLYNNNNNNNNNKTEEIIYINNNDNNNNRNTVLYTKGSYEIKSLYDSKTTNSNSNNTNQTNYTNNNVNNRTQLLKVNRNEALLKNQPIPNVKKIKVNNIVKRKKYIFNKNNSLNMDGEGEAEGSNDNDNVGMNKDMDNNDNNKNGLNNIQSRTNQKTIFNMYSRRNNNINNSNYYNVYNKAANINKNNEREANKKFVIKNIMNHNYVESINIKNKK